MITHHWHRFCKRGTADARAADGVPQSETAEREGSQESFRRDAHYLGKQIREIGSLYGIAAIERQGVPLNGLPQGIANLIPPALQHSQIACSRILSERRDFKRDGCRKPDPKHACEVSAFGSLHGAADSYYFSG